MGNSRLAHCLLVLSALFCCMSGNGQTQQGYVKTLGRPSQKGRALSGVSIRVKGEHNNVLSKSDGTFAMFMMGKRNGDPYSLQEVKKGDYELNETGIIGRQYAYSDKVPLTIIMVSSAQLRSDKQRIENNAYKVAERNYKAKLEILEKQKSDNAISEEQYRKELLDLQDKFEKYQLLIDGLAEHYAHVDYDDLSDKESEINICIENGELERADSLIKTMFDPIDVLKRNKEALSQLNQQIAEANTIINKANEDMAAVLKQQEKDANYLYQLYTIALSRFDNDKAGFYIETRAELDTTNVEWNIEAGDFFCEYLADYSKSLRFYSRCLELSKDRSGELSEWSARVLNRIGNVHNYLSNYLQALEFNLKALNIFQTLFGKEHAAVAACLNSIGGVYSNLGNYAQALINFEKALSIDLITADSISLATSYNNIGHIYDNQGNYAKALDYYQMALGIDTLIISGTNTDIATIYDNIGSVSSRKGDYKKALDYCRKAMTIWKDAYGEKHPLVALSYNNIGGIYGLINNYDTALVYHLRALEIRKQIYGVDHPDVAESFNNLGGIYSYSKDYHNALKCYVSALHIQKKVLDEGHPDIAASYNNIGGIFSYLGDFDQALANYKEALLDLEKVLGKLHPRIAVTYNNIGMTYFHKGEFEKALESMKKCIYILEKDDVVENIDAAWAYCDIALIYRSTHDYDKALNYFLKSEKIMDKIGTSDILEIYDNLSKTYRELGNYLKSSEYQKKAFYLLLNK